MTYPPVAKGVVRRPPVRRPLPALRRMIARNLERSARLTVPATMSLPVDVSQLAELRQRLNAEADASVRVTFTDLILKAVAIALVDNPVVRTVIEGDELVELRDIDISLAVGLGDEGLLVPVIRDCDVRGVRDIAEERARVVDLARARKLAPDDSRGGCFTVTNLGGGYDLAHGTPVLNLPQSGALGAGGITETVVAVDGAPAVRPVMNLFMTIDHRVVDGEPAARFLNAVRDLLRAAALDKL